MARKRTGDMGLTDISFEVVGDLQPRGIGRSPNSLLIGTVRVGNADLILILVESMMWNDASKVRQMTGIIKCGASRLGLEDYVDVRKPLQTVRYRGRDYILMVVPDDAINLDRLAEKLI